MKRLCVFITVVLVIATLFSACSANGKIKSVLVDDKEYKTVYLYSFKDAEIDKEYDIFMQTDKKPTVTGFIYSNKKLLPGETIRVWGSYYFHSDENNSSNSISYSDAEFYGAGTNAVVDKLIDTFPIQIKSTSDTYIITYYQVPGRGFSTVSQKADILKIEPQKIEVTKERVTIQYK